MDKKLKGLLDDKLSWLKDLSNENIILHNDIDALLSMGFLQTYANMNQIVGIYDLDAFYMKDKSYYNGETFKKLCAIDLDISFYSIRSIGHHMTCISSYKNSLNINEEVYKFSNVEDMVDNYWRKFPLNTVILLYVLFGIEPSTDEEIALLVYADSVFQNYKSYEGNVTYWLNQLNQNKILDALENRYEDILHIIDTKIAPIANTIKSRKPYSQCSLTSKGYIYEKVVYKYNGNPKKIIKMIRELTNWTIIELPEELYAIKYFNNVPVNLGKDVKTIKENIVKLKNFLYENKESVISSSMTYKDGFKITITKKNTRIELVSGEYKFVEG